jgi:hypothetical protein
MPLARRPKGSVRSKYNNKKTKDSTGEERDSGLEVKFYSALENFKVQFEKQHRELLQDTFRSPDGKMVRLISITVDAYIKDYNGVELFIDPKGYATEDSILRFKMLERKLQDEGRNYLILFLRSESDVRSCAVRLKNNLPLVAGTENKKRPMYKKPY